MGHPFVILLPAAATAAATEATAAKTAKAASAQSTGSATKAIPMSSVAASDTSQH